MSKSKEIAYKNEIFRKRALALNNKMLAAMNGESINVCLSAVLSMLQTVAQNVEPKDIPV